MNVDDIARLQKLVSRTEACPRPVLRGKHKLVVSNARGCLIRKHASDQRMHVSSGLRRHNPIRMPESFHANTTCDDVEQVPAPSVPALISDKAILDSAVG